MVIRSGVGRQTDQTFALVFAAQTRRCLFACLIVYRQGIAADPDHHGKKKHNSGLQASCSILNVLESIVGCHGDRPAVLQDPD